MVKDAGAEQVDLHARKLLDVFTSGGDVYDFLNELPKFVSET